jgi:uncharacterized protein YjiK
MTIYYKRALDFSFRTIGLFFLLLIALNSEILGQDSYVRLIQKIKISQLPYLNQSGLNFSKIVNTFRIVPALKSDDKTILSTKEHELNFDYPNIINTTFDDKSKSLLIFDSKNNAIVEMKVKGDGSLDTSPVSVIHHRIDLFNPEHLQGMTTDPESGDIFFLIIPQLPESARIIHVRVSSVDRFDGPAARREDRVRTIELSLSSSSQLKGIAFNPNDGHLYIMSYDAKNILELNEQGDVISRYDISSFDLIESQNMIFAPSGDQTDDPSIQSLYILDNGVSSGKGELVELTLTQSKRVKPRMIAAEYSLIQTILTSDWTPPSPDPSGIAYIPSSNSLVISDGEVNETGYWNPPIYTGTNVWERTLTNTSIQEWPTTGFSDEPTGVAYNPYNDNIFITDDTGTRSIYELDPGPDGDYGSPDDIVSQIATAAFGSSDPEGIAYDTHQGHLFMVDGVNAEVYEIDPGSNNVFDGVPPDGDDVVTSFDVSGLGAQDPEGVEFNTDTGNLYILGSNDIIVETTRSGGYVDEFDLSSFNPRKPAGLAYAPTSNNPLGKSLYIIARGVDNDSDPNENDGELFEISLGSAIPSISIGDIQVIEGDNATVNADFTVTLSSVSQDVVTVDYNTGNGSATTGDNDYVAKSGQVSFQPGETSQPISIVVNGDLTDEPDETFFVNLSNGVNASIADNQGTGTILNDDGPEIMTISLQDGMNGYNGTRDTQLESGTPNTNYGDATILLLDGSPDDISSLLYWDLASIPAGSIIQSAGIQINVLDGSPSDFEMYEMMRPWVESEATWNEYAAGQSWQTAGADGSLDRGSTVLGTFAGNTTGLRTFTLNTDGVALVQSWVDDPASNNGLIIVDYANNNGIDFSSREDATVSNRPELTVGFIPNNDQVLVETRLFLEGPYDAIGDTMKTDLRDNDVIPLTSPYSEDPRTVASIPENITDWVLVQLRETESGAAVSSKSALLRNDGHIVADDGTTEQISMDISENNYFIVVNHRNHLAVMSANSVQLNSSSSSLYDFSTGTGQYYGSGAKELETGVFGMFTGDANGNDQVQNDDKNVDWAAQVGGSGYRGADFNLNGQVQNDDKNVYWNANVGAGTQVP